MSGPLYRASERVIFTPLVDGTGVLLHLDSKFYFTLNATGVAVWSALASGAHAIDALTRLLAERFDVDADRARADVTALIEDLAAESLVEKAA